MFSKYVLFKKGHLNKRAGVWTPWTPLDAPLSNYLDEEVEFVLSHVAEIHLELDGDLEREEQLVLLEDARAAVVVDVVRERVHYVAQAPMYRKVRNALPQRKLKHLRTE